jgi:hypothetical protein
MKYHTLLPAPQQMRDWCSILAQEMLQWPGVKMCHVFGTCAFYHRKVMFAMLPDERSLDSSTAISFRAPSTDQTRQDAEWSTFELTNRGLVGAALVSLEKAYRNSILHPFSDVPIRSKTVTNYRNAPDRESRDLEWSADRAI